MTHIDGVPMSMVPAAAAGAHVYWVIRFVRGAGQYHV